MSICMLLAGFAAAQSAGDGSSAGRERARDHAEQRQQWFQNGRTALGESAASLLNRAYQRKLQMRSRSTTESGASPRFEITGTPNFPQLIWTNMGPSPLDSDPTLFQSYGPVTGRVTAIAVDQKDLSGNTVYIGAAFGGVWKSTNAATSDPNSVVWQSVFDDQPTLAVGAIAIQPGANGNVILVGTGESNGSFDSYYGLGILRSSNGGASWTLIVSANGGARPLRGLGFSRIAFSTTTPTLVVAAATATNGVNTGAESQGADGRGFYVSTDAGLTWSFANVQDISGSTQAGSVTDVAFNPAHNKFYAILRSHGYYESSDGTNWTRMINQPGTTLSTSNCPAVTNAATCPLVRGQLSVMPGSGETFTVWVDATANPQSGSGIYKLATNGGSWQQLGQTGIGNCGDPGADAGCGLQQGAYDLALTAVPSGVNTDLYLGSVNVFKCSIIPSDPLCSTDTSWKNLTHVYGCGANLGAPAHVHPGQHSMEYAANLPNVIYFANDGGVYRSLNGPGLNSSSCAVSNPFDNLSATMGSLSQFVSFSQHPADPGILLGGLQDNGSPVFEAGNSGANGKMWRAANLGDGGYNAIDPNSTNTYFTSFPSGQAVQIQRCTLGASCRQNNWSFIADSATMGGDSSAFYMPFMLDPRTTGTLIAGTCRIWRGTANGLALTAISNNFSTGDASTCSGGTLDGHTKVRSLAAGGPQALSGNSKVIYAGMVGRAGGAPGKIFVTTDSDVGAGGWADRTGNINPSQYDISDIAISPFDSSGKTAYLTIMGFGSSHVFKTVDAGVNWADKTGDLPDVPVNSIALDPDDHNILYVGTDIGVFFSGDDGVSWAELGSAMPNVAVVKLMTFTLGNIRKLRAATYGRGLWQVDRPVLSVSSAPSALSFGGVVLGRAGQQLQTILSNNTAIPLSISSIVALGNFSVTTHNCPATLGSGASCAIVVSFSPVSGGPQNGTLTINYPGGPQSVSLSGSGVDFALSLLRPKRPSRNGGAGQIILAGESAEFELALQTTGNAGGANFSFACTGAPANSICRVDPLAVVVSEDEVIIRVRLQTFAGIPRSQRLGNASGSGRTPRGAYKIQIHAISGLVDRKSEMLVMIR